MSKYQRLTRGEDWMAIQPQDEIAAVLDLFPHAEVVIGDTHWRRAPEPVGLRSDIEAAIMDNHHLSFQIEEIIDVLRNRDLI